MWRPTRYGAEDFAAFREAMDASPVEAVVIHAVYLINCATKDRELRKKSLASLTHALRIGDGIGAAGVVLHPGAQKGEPLGPSMKRAAKVIAAALEETRRAARCCSSRPPATKGCSAATSTRPRELIELAGGGERLGLCLDSCHLFVQGYDITDAAHLVGGRSTRPTRRSGSSGCAAVHVNDAAAPARLLPRPPRQHRQGRDGQAGPRRLPLRAPLRGAAGDARDAGPEQERPGPQGSAAAKRLRKAGLEARRLETLLEPTRRTG